MEEESSIFEMEENKRIDYEQEISICTRSTKENQDKQSVILDFEKLNFNNDLCLDSTDVINFNDGLEANPFDKLAKYYGKNKDIFLFISTLRDEEFSNKIAQLINQKCNVNEKDSFIRRINIYLNRIKQGELDAQALLNKDIFPGAFFNGYHCGKNPNKHENLNVNFSKMSLVLNVSSIFQNTSKMFLENETEVKRIKLYDNGKRSVSIHKLKNNTLNYTFTPDSSCELILKRLYAGKKCELIVNINAGKIFDIQLTVNGEQVDIQLLSTLQFTMDCILLQNTSIADALKDYFSENISLDCKPAVFELECLPIKSLDEVLFWMPPKTKLQSHHLRKRLKTSGPKTLVCHDMKGNYLNDRLVNGVRMDGEYFLVHWANIDTFVYFSHHLVTIPPCTWVSAAHINGVQILGTFITEWEDGYKICEKLFQDEKFIHELSLQLVNIAVHYNFDGWLINIENPLKPCWIPVLKKFVRYLSQRMHACVPDSLVIWYDSVIKNGSLKWQNALNSLNRVFFDECDGIFLNYNWTEENLDQSVKTAGSRKTDVYVGVDVFGRGCLGGGGFNSNVAVSEARKFGLSFALFAPGWVYECLDSKNFTENQFKFWQLLQEFTPPRAMEELPFYTSFCPGFGKKMFTQGKVTSDKAWFNLSLQQPQPNFESKDSFSMYAADGFNGGGCLLLSGETLSDPSLYFRLLNTHFHLKCVTNISYTFKPLTEGAAVHLFLNMESTIGNRIVNLMDRNAVDEFHLPSEDDTHWIKRTYILHENNSVLKEIGVKVIGPDASCSILLGELMISNENTPVYNLSFKDLEQSRDGTVHCMLQWQPPSEIAHCEVYVRGCYLGNTTQHYFPMELHPDGDCSQVQVSLHPFGENGQKFADISLNVSLPLV